MTANEPGTVESKANVTVKEPQTEAAIGVDNKAGASTEKLVVQEEIYTEKQDTVTEMLYKVPYSVARNIPLLILGFYIFMVCKYSYEANTPETEMEKQKRGTEMTCQGEKGEKAAHDAEEKDSAENTRRTARGTWSKLRTAVSVTAVVRQKTKKLFRVPCGNMGNGAHTLGMIAMVLLWPLPWMCVISEDTCVFLWAAWVAGVMLAIVSTHHVVSLPLFLIVVALLFYKLCDVMYSEVVFGESPFDLPGPSAAAAGMQLDLIREGVMPNKFNLIRTNAGARQQVRALDAGMHPDIETGMLNSGTSVWEIDPKPKAIEIKKKKQVNERFEKARSSVAWLSQRDSDQNVLD